MPTHVLYQIPLAAGAARFFMLCACSLFVVGIYGWWLPKILKFRRKVSSHPGGQKALAGIVLVLPVALGLVPLILVIALIKNPATVVTDTGIIGGTAFGGTPTALAWNDIRHVDCHVGRDGRITRLRVVSPDGRRIEVGNASNADLNSLHEMLGNQLGHDVVRHCDAL